METAGKWRQPVGSRLVVGVNQNRRPIFAWAGRSQVSQVQSAAPQVTQFKYSTLPCHEAEMDRDVLVQQAELIKATRQVTVTLTQKQTKDMGEETNSDTALCCSRGLALP